jgi:hypothetical protein
MHAVNTSDLTPLEAPRKKGAKQKKDVRPSWLAGARLTRSN